MLPGAVVGTAADAGAIFCDTPEVVLFAALVAVVMAGAVPGGPDWPIVFADIWVCRKWRTNAFPWDCCSPMRVCVLIADGARPALGAPECASARRWIVIEDVSTDRLGASAVYSANFDVSTDAEAPRRGSVEERAGFTG
jgi:hypothetical protein